ncbi:MAG: histidine phosphatase family protein [Anaerolineaceae bacterium]|nr:histidine phosphatase family protein [Anaerolineaceae bacterium]
MTKTLFLMRHGKSSWKEKGIPDEKRPLKKRGVESATMIGRTLKANEIVPELILSSPAKRAKNTAEIVAKESHYPNKPELVESFYMGEPSDYIARLQQIPAEVDKVMLIGHNPGLEALLQLIDGHVDAMPTGSLAVVKLDVSSWEAVSMETTGNMIAFWDPEQKTVKSSKK